MTNNFRVLIYADIDLNIIDGSSIWVTSISETFAQIKNVNVSVMLKRPIIRDILTSSLNRLENIEIINPWDINNKKVPLKNQKRLSPEAASLLIEELDSYNQFDLVLIRGYELAKQIAYNRNFSFKTWFYITDFPQKKEEITEEDISALKTIYNSCEKLACQTPEIIDLFQGLLGLSGDDDKFVYLPPMIPSPSFIPKEFKNRNNRLIYAGKFTPLWKVPDMFEVFKNVELPIEFIVAGDKFHNYPYSEGYSERVTHILESTPRVKWKKGLSRKQVQECIIEADVGVSWRAESMNDSKELSTKVLEYGINGKPVILNRNKLHESFFGEDYPLYANTPNEFLEKIILSFTDSKVYAEAAERVYNVSKDFTFSKVSQYLEPHLKKNTSSINTNKKINILFAGHDLKFAKHIINYFKNKPDYLVKLDEWQGHNKHDEENSNCLINWADVIIAEWGLGNAVWYSRNKKKNQVLIVRFHNQEKNTQYPKQIKWKNVDQLVFIAPESKKELGNHFSYPDKKAKVIYNVLDTESFNREKLVGHEFNIGLLGMVPKLKRIDYAVKIFECLWRKDSRYTLYIKGKLPNEYNWLWNRNDEREYYMSVFKEINQSPFRNSIVFERWGDDVSEWFRKIGYILSTSDSESFHLAVAEGMASGSIPIIRNWKGAKELYPQEFIFDDVNEGSQLIEEFNSNQLYKKNQDFVKDYVQKKFDVDIICKEWENLVLNHYSEKSNELKL